jgi:hypothetical protein
MQTSLSFLVAGALAETLIFEDLFDKFDMKRW